MEGVHFDAKNADLLDLFVFCFPGIERYTGAGGGGAKEMKEERKKERLTNAYK